jgi:hypothetical protein
MRLDNGACGENEFEILRFYEVVARPSKRKNRTFGRRKGLDVCLAARRKELRALCRSTRAVADRDDGKPRSLTPLECEAARCGSRR